MPLRHVAVRYMAGPSMELCADGAVCESEEGGAVLVRDDLDALLEVRMLR
jgi:hypothetical protein